MQQISDGNQRNNATKQQNDKYMKIQARLESITFGKVVSKYYTIPDWLIDNTVDNELSDTVINYLLKVSGYKMHQNEIITFWTK